MKQLLFLTAILFSLTCYGQKYSKDLEKLAKSGDVESQYQVALCYMNGYGIDADRKKAEKWLNNAAKNGHSKACYELSGLLTDREEQKKWLIKATADATEEMKISVAKRLYELTLEEEAHDMFVQMMKWDVSKRETAIDSWINVCKKDALMLSWMLRWIKRDTDADYRTKIYICDKMMKNSQEYYADPALEELATNGDASVKVEVGKVFASMSAQHYQSKAKKYFSEAAELGNAEAIFILGKEQYESGDKTMGRRRLETAANNGYQPAKELLEQYNQEEEKAKREEEEAKLRAAEEARKLQVRYTTILQSYWKCEKGISFVGEITGTPEGDAAWNLWGIDHSFFEGGVGLSLRNDGNALLVSEAVPSPKALKQGQGRTVQVGAFCRDEFTKRIEGRWKIEGNEILLTNIPKDWKLTLENNNQVVVCSMRDMLIAKMKITTKE